MSRRTGGQILIDQLKIHGADTSSACPGESYLAVLDALYDAQLDPPRHLPPGRRRRDDGGGLWQADRPARHLLRDARPRRHQRQRRPAHRDPGFDADDPVHRPGARATRASARRSRRSTTAACSASWPNGWPRSTIRRRIPELVSRAFHSRPAAGPGRWCWRCPRTCWPRTAEVADARPYRARRAASGAGADARRCATLLAAAARPLADPRRRRLDAGRGRRASRRFAEANELPVGCAFRRQDRFDNAHPCYVGDVGHRHQSEARRAASARPTC